MLVEGARCIVKPLRALLTELILSAPSPISPLEWARGPLTTQVEEGYRWQSWSERAGSARGRPRAGTARREMALGGHSSENQESLATPVAIPSREAGPKNVHPSCSPRLTPPPPGSGRAAPLPFAGRARG